MAIIGSTLKTGATGITVTGGSDIVLAQTGLRVNNGIGLSVLSDTDLTTRRTAAFKSQVPVVRGKVFTMGQGHVTFSIPVQKSDGAIAFSTVELKLKVQPEHTSATVTDLRYIGAQLLAGSAYNDFWLVGSLA